MSNTNTIANRDSDIQIELADRPLENDYVAIGITNGSESAVVSMDDDSHTHPSSTSESCQECGKPHSHSSEALDQFDAPKRGWLYYITWASVYFSLTAGAVAAGLLISHYIAIAFFGGIAIKSIAGIIATKLAATKLGIAASTLGSKIAATKVGIAAAKLSHFVSRTASGQCCCCSCSGCNGCCPCGDACCNCAC